MLKHTSWHGIPWSVQGGRRDLTEVPAPDPIQPIAQVAQVLIRGGGTPPLCVCAGGPAALGEATGPVAMNAGYHKKVHVPGQRYGRCQSWLGMAPNIIL